MQGNEGRPVRQDGFISKWKQLRRWLQPGLGVKRWFMLAVLGTSLIGLGTAVLLLDIYRSNPESSWLGLISLPFLPRLLRSFLLGLTGTGLLIVSLIQLNRTLMDPYIRPGKAIVDAVAEHRRLGRGPKIVALGGGTGLSTLLRGLKEHTGNLTAIVTMADDGGSSGRLRESLGLPPPGDLRNCLAALSDDEDLITQLFQYRFQEGEDLNGHSFGNLFIAALSGVTGSFDRGITEAGNVLAIRGRVIPSTLSNVSLMAEKTPATDVRAVRIQGESKIPDWPGSIRQVFLEPGDPPAYPEAIHAILNANMIVIGPGSLYTSILPNLLIPDIQQAISTSKAFKVFVCNVATQQGETEDYDCERHLQALEAHIGPGLVDLVVANDNLDVQTPENTSMVQPPKNGPLSTPYYLANLADTNQPWRHNSKQLANCLIALLEERTGPLDLPPVDELEAAPGVN